MLVRGFRFSPFHCSSQHTLSYQTLLSLKRCLLMATSTLWNGLISPIFLKKRCLGWGWWGSLAQCLSKKPQLSLAGVQTQACVSVKPAPFVSVCFYIIVFLGLMLIIKPWLQSSVCLSIHLSITCLSIHQSFIHSSMHPSVCLSTYLSLLFGLRLVF